MAVDFISDSGYRGKNEEITERSIIMNLVRRLTEEIFKKQENNTIEVGNNIIRADIRETQTQGISYLKILLFPRFDDEIKEKYKEFKTKLKKLNDELDKSSMYFEASNKVKHIIDEDERQEMFEKWMKYFKENNILSLSKNTAHYELFLQKNYELHVELFGYLVCFLHRIDWISGGGLKM